VNIELACHAALPALADPAAAPVATTILERAAARSGPDPMVLRALARSRFQAGDTEAGRKYVLGVLKPPPPVAFTPSPAQAANEFARAGRWADAWDMAGRVADKMSAADQEALPAGVWEELVRQAAALAPAPRYE